jgi:hypothetical protein
MSSNFSAMTLPPQAGTTNITPAITNFITIAPNTEYSFSLPSNCRKFLIQSRVESAKIQLSYNALQSGITYVTIWPGCSFVDDSFYASQTIYFQSSLGSNTIEIITFS